MRTRLLKFSHRADPRLPNVGAAINKKLGIKVVADSTSLDLYRGIRTQIAGLLDGLNPQDLSTMSLGLSHSLSRYVLCSYHEAPVF